MADPEIGVDGVACAGFRSPAVVFVSLSVLFFFWGERNGRAYRFRSKIAQHATPVRPQRPRREKTVQKMPRSAEEMGLKGVQYVIPWKFMARMKNVKISTRSNVVPWTNCSAAVLGFTGLVSSFASASDSGSASETGSPSGSEDGAGAGTV